jgi:putative cell wall-binding protein
MAPGPGRQLPSGASVARFALAVLCLSLLALSGCSVGEDDSKPSQLGVKSGDDHAAQKLGFPSSATRNTVRIGGADAVSDAAGVAGALFPATGEIDRPNAVVLVDSDDWQTSLAASVLAGSPIEAPLLLSDGGKLAKVTEDTLKRLDPKGSDLSKDAQVIRVGNDVARPEDYRTALIPGDDAYARAAAIDRFVSAARGKPSADVLLYSGEQAAYALPAAAWAARSGTATLPVKRNEIPTPIRKALANHPKANVYLLGPPSVISTKLEKQLEKRARSVHRIEGRTPVANAIAFARYQQGTFGWGITIPGYNFTIANADRPLDAAASAALGTHGVFAPLLLTDSATQLPRSLESYLLSVQPGYEDDPGQAVYNRAWLLGDDTAISVRQQGRIDQITELVPVQESTP